MPVSKTPRSHALQAPSIFGNFPLGKGLAPRRIMGSCYKGWHENKMAARLGIGLHALKLLPAIVERCPLQQERLHRPKVSPR